MGGKWLCDKMCSFTSLNDFQNPNVLDLWLMCDLMTQNAHDMYLCDCEPQGSINSQFKTLIWKPNFSRLNGKCDFQPYGWFM